MIVCLCGCTEPDHALGEGICECGCPAFRPYRLYTEEDERHDRQHDGIAEEFMQVHSLTVEVTGDHLWVLLPEPEELPNPTRGLESSVDP
jgi:hypothetical protein